MTITDTRPETTPTVINGVYTDARDVPARNPHRTSTRIAAVIVLGAAAGFLTQLHGSDLEKGGAAFALFTAVAIFVTCLVRFNACAEAGYR